jgi:hypothetical protein
MREFGDLMPEFSKTERSVMRAAPMGTDLSLNEERREVLESVMDVLSRENPDPGEMAACGYLLTKLSQAIGA